MYTGKKNLVPLISLASGVVRRPKSEGSLNGYEPAPDLSRLAVFAHLHYLEGAEVFLESLVELECKSSFITVTSLEALQLARKYFHENQILLVENCGRNFSPLLQALRRTSMLESADFALHVHYKRSRHSPILGKLWAKRLNNFFLDRQLVLKTMGIMDHRPSALVAFPYTGDIVPKVSYSWGANERHWGFLLAAFGLEIQRPNSQQIRKFPVGGMFLVRSEILKLYRDSSIRLIDFPVESGQLDGELQHALERFIGEIVSYLGGEFLIFDPVRSQYALNRT